MTLDLQKVEDCPVEVAWAAVFDGVQKGGNQSGEADALPKAADAEEAYFHAEVVDSEDAKIG